MTKQESVMTAGGSDAAALSSEMVPDLRLCGNGDGCCVQGGGEASRSPRSTAEREEHAGRRQERVAWLTLAGVALPFFLPFFAPSPTTEEKVQVNVSVVVVENHIVVNPGYSVSVQAKEGMAK
ncbi:hypothetical protein [Streptomyces chartreusis]|uniref:hypothetical protein n=1 Tax=Streptomyces chartreusis TaxID=1969 RepID=UPI003800CEDB